MRLCVIGNSHVGALKLGSSEANAAFFAAHGRSLRSLRPQEGRLISDDPEVRRWLAFTSGGHDCVPVSDYDGFLIVGCGLGFGTTATIYRTHRLHEHAIDGEQIISRAALQQAANGLVVHSLARRIADRIRQISPAEVAILPEPLPAPTVIGHQPWLEDESIRRTLFELYREQLALLPYPVLSQPAYTVDRYFTKEEFSRGSLKLLEGERRHDEGEPYHMNADYGAAVMREAQAYFSEATTKSAVA